MDLTPEERKRIYLEEKARLEQSDSAAEPCPTPVASTNLRWTTPVTVIVGLIVVAFLLVTYLPEPSSSHKATPPPAPTQPAFGGREGQARRFMRGMGFTAEDTSMAMDAAATADPDLGTPFEVLERMANAATLGVVNRQVENSLGISEAWMRDIMGLKGLEQSEFTFRYLPTEHRLRILSLAMQHKDEIPPAQAGEGDLVKRNRELQQKMAKESHK